jgi:hypothetical protein
MSNELPISSPYRSTPEVPVSDAERDQLSRRLNAAYTDGQLQEDDYRARLDQLFAARKLGELVPVVQGLPPVATYNDPAVVASTGGQPGQLTESRQAGGIALMAVGGVALGILLIAILLLVLL